MNILYTFYSLLIIKVHILDFWNGKLSSIFGEYYFYDAATEIGYFEGDIIPGTNSALVNYGGLIPTGDAWKQEWTPFIGSEIYQYDFGNYHYQVINN